MAENNEQSSYLKQLRFDPKLLQSFVARYVINIRLMLLLVISVVVWGVMGYVNLPRRTNPEVQIPYIFVSTVLPGANPEDVEQLVTIPLEDAVEGVNNLTRLTSSSSENVSFVVAEFETSIDTKEARDEVQSAVDTVRLPESALDPNVMDLDFESIPVWTFTVTADADMATLIRFAEELQERVEKEPNVSSAAVTGLETQEFQILIRPEMLHQIGLNPMSLSQTITAQLTSYPSGSVQAQGSSHGVSIERVVNSLDELRGVQFSVDRKTYTLGEVAVVMEKSAPNQSKAFYADENIQQQRSVSFSIFKRTGADLDVSAREAKVAAAEVIDKYEGKFRLRTVLDFDEMIAVQFRDLFNDFFTSIGLVFGTLLMFLGIRQAMIASMVIPVSFLFTFGAVNALGLSLNFLTLFSLLLAQGMIVDDVIVIISAMTDYYKTRKFTPVQTGLLVWRDFIAPTLTSNLTNIWSFVPMFLITGIIGEFTKTIPMVVTMALIGSTAMSLLVTIPLMVLILKPEIPRRVVWLLRILGGLVVVGVMARFLWGNQLAGVAVVVSMACLIVMGLTWRYVVENMIGKLRNGGNGNGAIKQRGQRWSWKLLGERLQSGFFSIKGLVQGYKRMLLLILGKKSNRRKTILAVVAFSVFSYLLVPLGFIKNEFFPKTDQEQIYVGLELPVGTGVEETTVKAMEVLEVLRQTPEVEYVIAEVGAPVDNTFMTSVAGGESNKVRFSVKLPMAEERSKTSLEIASDLRDKFTGFGEGKIVVAEESSGPPTGADLQISLLGEDLGVLERKAEQVVAYLDRLPGAVDADMSVRPGVSQIVFVPDRSRMEAAGFSVSQVGMWMRTYLSGMKVGEERFGYSDKKDIVIRVYDELVAPEMLAELSIPDKDGVMVPLSSLGSFRLSASPTRIEREEGERSVTVTAAVEAGFNIPALGRELETFADGELDLPEGYTWKTGGVNEENQESINSIIQAMAVAAVLIAATMVVQLQSFRKALIVMLVIPLAVSGVYILFSLTGTPISFPALIGVLALFGIVVKNSILIVDKINANIEVGIPFREAVADGAASRLEPIIFSSVTNFIGLLPITISDPLWRGLGGAIISGLTFSGIIMLFFIPVVYYVWFEGEYEAGT